MSVHNQEIDTGMTPDEAIKVIRDWSDAARRDPPPSGPFLADDLRACADVLESALKRG